MINKKKITILLMKMPKSKKIIASIVAMSALLSVGAFALNGYFGGGGDNAIPEDTWTRGLVASWDFDEGSGDVAYDATTNNNHGNFPHTGPGLKFEGTDDYVEIIDDASLRFDAGTLDFSIFTWIKRDVAGIDHFIFDKRDADNDGYIFLIRSDNKVELQINGVDTISAGTIADTNWHFIGAVVDRDGNAQTYIDGIADGAPVAVGGEVMATTANPRIGARSHTSPADWFNGSIDEVRIYSRALGAAEVNEHYHGIFSDNTGRVGYWPFDEGEGDVVDNSGSCGANCDGDLDGYTTAQQVAGYGDTHSTGWTTLAAPLTDSAPSWTQGKEGGGLAFDGEDDYVDCGNDSSLNITDAITIEAWVKSELDSTNDVIIGNGWNATGFHLRITSDNKARFIRLEDGCNFRYADTSVLSSGWRHIVGVWDKDLDYVTIYLDGVLDSSVGSQGTVGSTQSSLNMYVGNIQSESQFFNGTIDGVKIYNRALSAEEVRYHYNRGGPVAHWSFDSGSGSVAYDATESRNHGTLKSSALDFDGTDDYVDCGSHESLTGSSSERTIEAWIYVTGGEGGFRAVVSTTNGSWVHFQINSNDKMQAYFYGPGKGVYSTILFNSANYNKWFHVAAVWDGTYARMYVNGVEEGTSSADSGDSSAATTNIYIGNGHENGRFFNGAIDEVRIYNVALTSEEVARHYDGDFSQDPTDDLVMLHHFEEGTLCDTCADPGGVDANCLTDDSGAGNHGTLYNFDDLPNYDAGVDGWITTVKKPKLRWTGGRFASAGKFDGGGDRVYQAYDSAFDFTTNSFTISSWFKHNTIAISSDYLLSRYDDDQGYKVWMDDSGDMCFGIDDDNSWGPDDSACTSGIDYDDNEWHHLTAYKDGTSAIYLYIDSVLVASKNGLTATGTLTSNSATMNIGSDAGVGSVAPNASYYINTWEGEIDDMKIYGYGRSADEIRLDYNAGYAARFGGLAMSDISNCSSDPAACMDLGLVGHWNMDEAGGDTLYDQSDNGNDGTLGSGAGADTADPKWVGGQTSSQLGGGLASTALSFDGNDDYVNCGNDPSLDITDAITIEAWVKADTSQVNYPIIIHKGTALNNVTDAYMIRLEQNGYLNGGVYTSSTKQINGDTDLRDNTWHHCVFTYDKEYLKLYLDGQSHATPIAETGSINTVNTNLEIGRWVHAVNYTFNGSIDGVKIYNRALSAEEVRYHYNRGGPVAHWKFDEGSGESAQDSSGNNNDGTLKSSALDFDGTNDYVDTNSTFQSTFRDSFTIEAWIKPTDGQPATDCYYVGANNSSPTEDYVTLRIYSNGKIGLYYKSNDNPIYSITASAVFSNGQQDWHHIVILVDKTVGSYGQIYIYFDGVLQTLDATHDGDLDTNSVVMGDWTCVDELFIGARDVDGTAKDFFDGSIDEVRIYNAALSAEEVARHYNGDFSQDPTGNLKLLYHFEEGTSCKSDVDNCVTDDSAQSNDGMPKSFDNMNDYDNGVDGWITTVKKPALRWTTGKDKSAGNFDGGGDYVEIADDASLDITDAITVGGWLKSNSLVEGRFFSKTTAYRATFGENGDEIKVTVPGAFDHDTTTANLQNNIWYYVAWTYDRQYSRIYLDGVEISSAAHADAIPSTADNFYIGQYGSSNSQFFDGSIDDVRIYAYARSADEIRLDYNAGFAARFGGLTSHSSGGQTSTLCARDPASCMDLGLVGHWNMDEAGGDTLYDQSDNGNDGTLGSSVGADTSDPKWIGGQASPQLGGGLASTALSFDGKNDYVNCGNDSSLDITDAITIEAWVKYGTFTGLPRIVDKSRDSAYSLRINTDGKIELVAEYGGVAKMPGVSDSGFTKGEWGHVIATYDGNTIKYYINSVAVGEKTPSPAGNIGTNSENLVIGAQYNGGNYFFNGSIDGVKIYNRALSAEEVRYHYNRGGPVAHWKFDEGEGAKAYDESGNRNHGTLTGSTSGTADSGSTTTLVDTALTQAEDFWNDYTLKIVTTTDALAPQGETATITGFAAGTDTLTFAALTAAVAADDTYKLYSGDEHGPTWVAGKHFGSLSFDGTDDYVDCGNDSSLNITDEITFEAWVKTSYKSTHHVIAASRDIGGANNGWRLLIEQTTGNVQLLVDTSAGTINPTSSTDITDGSYHHIIGIWDGSTVKIYVDGNEENSDSLGGTISKNVNTHIGKGTQSSFPFNGSIDDVKIYNYARTQEQILVDYNAGLGTHIK